MAVNWKKWLAIGLVALVFLLLPVVVNLRTDITNLLVLLFVYIVLAQSWNLLGGYTGQVNLGLAALFGGGVMATRLIWQTGVPIPLALIVGGLTAVALSLIIGLPVLRLKGVYFAIGTLAFAQVCSIVVSNTFTAIVQPPAHIIDTYSLIPRYYIGIALAIIATVVVYFVMNSRLGLAFLAVRDDEDAAQVTGVNVFKNKVFALLISAFLAGLGGGLYGYYMLSFTSFADVYSPVWTFAPLMAVMIGGAGTIFGPIVGSVFLVILSQVFALTLGDAHLILFGILFILVVLYFPYGLVGSADRIAHFFASLFHRFRKNNQQSLP